MARVYPETSTWTQAHRRWLAAQQFSEAMSAFTYAELIAAVDGLSARKKMLARSDRCARDRPDMVAYRDKAQSVPWHRHADRTGNPPRARRRLGTVREAHACGVVARAHTFSPAVRGVRPAGIDYQDRVDARPPAAGRVRLAIRTRARASAPRSPTARTANPITSWRSPTMLNSACTTSYTSMKARGKPHNVTVVAVARELSCFLWAAATAP